MLQISILLRKTWRHGQDKAKLFWQTLHCAERYISLHLF